MSQSEDINADTGNNFEGISNVSDADFGNEADNYINNFENETISANEDINEIGDEISYISSESFVDNAEDNPSELVVLHPDHVTIGFTY